MNPIHYFFKIMATPVVAGLFAVVGWFLGGLQASVIAGVLGMTLWMIYAALVIYHACGDIHASSSEEQVREASSVGRAALLQSEGQWIVPTASHHSYQDLLIALAISALMALIHAIDRTLVAFGRPGVVIR